MRRALALAVALSACTQSTAGFDTITPPPVPTLAATGPMSSAFPMLSFAPPTFPVAPGPVSTFRTVTPSPAATRATQYVHAVWSHEVVPEGLRYDLLFVGFPAGTRAVWRSMSSVTTGPMPSPNLSVEIAGSPFRLSRTIKSTADTFLMQWRVGDQEHLVPLVVNRTMAAWIAGTAAPPRPGCSTGPVTLRFDPPRLRNMQSAKLIATGLCTGTLIHSARFETPDGRVTITSGNLSVVNHPEVSTTASGTLAPGRYIPYYWIDGKEYAVPFDVFQ